MTAGLSRYLALTSKPARAPRKPRVDREGPVQRAIIDMVRTVAPNVDIRHIPNGGMRNVRVAQKLKRDGVRPGTPDLMLVLSSGEVAFIECKASAAHKLEGAQLEFFDMFKARGGKIAVCADAALIPALLTVWGEPVIGGVA